MSTRELARRLAVITELEKRIKAEKDLIRSEFAAELEPGDAKAAALEDETRLGRVYMARGKATAAVLDEAALLRWVKANHPGEVVEAVRPSYRAHLLETAKRMGMGVDETTGEVIPGIEVREGDPYVAYRADKGAGDVIASRWRELVTATLLPEA